MKILTRKGTVFNQIKRFVIGKKEKKRVTWF